MPIYEYRCDQGHTFEVMRRMTDEPLSTCQTCSAPVEQVFYPIAIHFKGSGFYNTDYGTKKRSREQQEKSNGEKAAETKETKVAEGATTSETKPSETKATETKAAKPETKAAAPSKDS
jgi:putative FmdB family regulatory protein